MMENILLGNAGDIGGGAGQSVWKKHGHGSTNPDVHGKTFKSSQSVEKHAVSDFGSHAVRFE